MRRFEGLQDLVGEPWTWRVIENPSCKADVAKTISRGPENIRFAVEMAQACKGGRQKFCEDVPPVRLLSPLPLVSHKLSAFHECCMGSVVV